jgi:hypothetical protein
MSSRLRSAQKTIENFPDFATADKNYFNLEVLIWTLTVAATETVLAPWMAHLLIHEKLLSTDYGMRGEKRKEKTHPLDHRWIPHQGVT